MDPFKDNDVPQAHPKARYPIWPLSAMVAVAALVVLQNIIHTTGLSSTVVLLMALVTVVASLWGVSSRRLRGIGDGGLLPSIMAVGLLGSYPVYGSFYFLAERSGFGGIVSLVLIAGVLGVPVFSFARRLSSTADESVPRHNTWVVAIQVLLLVAAVHLVAGPLLGLWMAGSVVVALSSVWMLYSMRSRSTAWVGVISAIAVVLAVNMKLTTGVVMGTTPFATYTYAQQDEGKQLIVNEKRARVFSRQLVEDVSTELNQSPEGITVVVDGIYGLGVPDLFQSKTVVFVERDLAMPVALTLVEERSIPLDSVLSGSLSESVSGLPFKPLGIISNLASPSRHEPLNLLQVEAAIRAVEVNGRLVWIQHIDALQSLAEISTRYAASLRGCYITLYASDELAGLFCQRSSA